MDRNEILTSFRQAKDKREQVHILADLTGSDEETVEEILKDAGLYVTIAKCRKCHRTYQKYISPYCPDCKLKIETAKRKAEEYRRWVRWLIRENEVKRYSLLRQIAMIDEENRKLKETL